MVDVLKFDLFTAHEEYLVKNPTVKVLETQKHLIYRQFF